MTILRRPAFRYHGGKWKLAPWIISHFPAHRIYVEPFCGAASVLLRKPRAYAEVLNDTDGDVVNLFRVLRDERKARKLQRALEFTPFARAEFEQAYEPCADPIERARRLVCRAAMGFGANAVSTQSTGFRNNTIRSGSTPTADFASWPAHVPALVRRLRGVVIENKPALEVLQIFDTPETLFYVDPPYPASTRNLRNRYRHQMKTDDEHRALAQCLRSLQGMAIISGYPCELYDRELYPDWQRIERKTFADGARKRTEVLWLSPNIIRENSMFKEF
jgi:DNA adenine methylase